MNNFIENINDNNQMALILTYGENGSYIPVDMFYLEATTHAYSFDDGYELKEFDAIYYNDDAYFFSNDNKLINLKVGDCVRLFEKYVGVSEGFSFDAVNFENFMKYEDNILEKHHLYTLDELNANYENGVKQMGRNYSLIPVVIKCKTKKYDEFNYPKETYADFNLVRKLKKRACVKR